MEGHPTKISLNGTTWASRANRRAVALAFFFLGTGIPLVGQSLELSDGKWSGRYIDHTGESFKIRYVVTSQKREDQKIYTIKMIFLGIDNANTEILRNFTITEKELRFTMGEGDEIETCHLSKNEEKKLYKGHCQSSLDKEGEKLSTISMVPPRGPSPE